MPRSKFDEHQAGIIAELEAIEWDFADADTSHSAHAIQPYPAKFPPQIPEHLISVLSEPQSIVLDCFGGCGTSAIEALRLGRASYVIDANPVATLVTKVKTAGLDKDTRASIEQLISYVEVPRNTKQILKDGGSAWRPQIPNIDRWYAPHVVNELSGIRAVIESRVAHESALQLSLSVFAHVASRMSFQDSETRYKSVPREIPPGQATDRFLTELRRHIDVLGNSIEVTNKSTVIRGDARDSSTYPEPNSVRLVITSPPYPNAYDYHLYHRFRIYWLGNNPGELRDVEIGSHLTNQTTRDPIAKYELDIARVMSNVYRSLAPSGHAAFVVGSGLHHGVVYNTTEAMIRLGSLSGFEHLVTLRRTLPLRRRSVTAAGRRLNVEDIVVLRKPSLEDLPCNSLPPYELYPYEKTLSTLESLALSQENGSRDRRQAAFRYSISDETSVEPTYQKAAEYNGSRPLKKNSTYIGHGLHRYKGKFYPQLAKSLINITDPYGRPGVVLDPFGGSGTVCVEARLAGLNAVSMDLNPLAVAIARAKVVLMDVSADELNEGIEVVARVTDVVPRAIDWGQFDESVREELQSWFPEKSLASLAHLLASIRGWSESKESRQKVRMILEVVVSDLIREVSHQEPTDLRIRRRLVAIEDAPVLQLFIDRASKLLDRRKLFQHRLDVGPGLGSALVVHGDSAIPEPYADSVDLLGNISAVVSSPPYGVALPYLDTDRLSLAAIYGYNKRARAQLEDLLIGSREITGRDRASWESMLSDTGAIDLPSSTLAFVESLFAAVSNDPKAGFRKLQTPAVLLRYFVSMNSVLRQVSERMNPNAQLAFVLGNSQTTVSGERWTIPTIDEILAIAKCHGLALVNDIPITVTRDAPLHSRNAITSNRILHLRSE